MQIPTARRMSATAVAGALAAAAILSLAACARQPVREAPRDAPRDGARTRADGMQLGAADAAMSGGSGGAAAGRFAALHLELTPARAPSAADSARAWRVVRELRSALARYRDTSAANADGYRIFMPELKGQRTFHFTSRRRAFGEAFRWDPAKPTSLLYSRDAAGRFTLVGAMYTMPARASHSALDERVPLSLAQWHRHVNWCIPPRGERARWLEQRDGAPLFGPESPIATRAACDAVGGRFHDHVFGWMVHVNAFAGEDLASIYGHEHHVGGGAAGHSGHEGHSGHDGH